MTALYIHIPFCKKKCNYCDFVSYAGKEGLIDAYIEALCKEITTSPLSSDFVGIHSPLHKVERGGTNEVSDGVRTIYFGGGTPTLLEPKHFEKILSSIPYPLPPEISLESNPGTANKEKLKAFHDLGINRLSIGVQSFNDQHLKTLGRIHDSKIALQFYHDARKAGFTNINLDLMFALPDQTLEEWQADLQTAIDLKPEHLSTYNLQIEEGTPLFLHPTVYGLPPTQETELAMYQHTIETLTSAGYHHYEISNFAKPGFECQHNINYWKNGNYIGIGAGAHSHVNGRRWANTNSIEEYIRSASGDMGNEMRNALRLTPNDSHLSTAQRETLFLGLRLLDGLSIEHFKGFEKEVAELIKDGLLEKHNNDYRLTKQGLYLGNLVFEKFI
ncbi:MAG: radical SAM family heme chaperone HemW [bacterium]